MDISNKELLKDKCYINGNWISSDSKEEIEVNDPATLNIIGSVPKCGSNETKLAINAANNALPIWKAKTAKERSILLKKWFDLIILNQEDLAKIMTLEQGKPINESRGEIIYGASFVELYAEEGKRVYGETIPDPLPDRRIVIIKQPIGVVAAITPWNFPNSMITRKAAPALAVGCTIVIKPASQTPYSALALGVLAEKAGIPKGVINIITGSAKEIGLELSTNPIIKKLSFTGSTEIGKILLAQSASTVEKVSMELGGHAPFIVFEDADIDEAVIGVMQSKFRNTGQTCVCANRIFVHQNIYDQFINKFADEVAKIKVGNGMNENVSSGPLIDKNSLAKVKDHVADALNNGAKVIIGGEMHPLGGNFYQPTILSNVTSKSKITYEETFGPIAPVYKFNTEEEVIKMANDTPYGLASYFYSRDLGTVWRVAEALEYGMVGVNTGLTSKAEIPFGGVKESGIGREGSRLGLDEYLEVKYISMAGI